MNSLKLTLFSNLQAYNFIKPFLHERIRNSIIFHNSLESLHDHVPKEILPKELGGSYGSYDNSECAQAVLDIQKHFTNVQEFIAANSIEK